MLSKLNLGILSGNKLNSFTPASQRINEIDQKINYIQGTNTGDNISFSDILPNVKEKEPVKLLKPETMINLIQSNAKKYGVDPKLVNAVIKNESGYNANACSSQGALGLMQLMPDTARSLGVTDLTDPAQNVEAGTKYLGQLLSQYNGNVVLALAAYNAGPGAVNSNNGVPPYKETRDYIYKVLDTYVSTSRNS
ncbi:MAG: lytic transglycosylase domain-containing protein [Vampirovibrionia bacterium]